MTIKTITIQTRGFKVVMDLILVNIISALLITVIAFFPDSPARTILGLPFILFFPGYVLICALFPRRDDLAIIERLALSMGLSIVVMSLMGLALNYTPLGIRLYPVIFSLFLFVLLVTVVVLYRRSCISPREAFAPLALMNITEWQSLGIAKNEFMKSSIENKLIKIATIICLILITLTLIMARNSPATGYEASIYKSTPILLWFSLVLSTGCGIAIIVQQIYSRAYEKHNLWLIGFFLVFLSYIICLSLHIVRGYYMWCMIGDPATHIATIKQIITGGYIPEIIFYPISIIYSAELSLILNIDLISLHKLIPLFFGLLFVPCMYALANSILQSKGQVILATVASCALIYGWYLNLTPNHLSNLLFPLLLFILVKVFTTRQLQWEILLVIMVFFYPPFHPVPTLALLIILNTLWLPESTFALINKNTSQTTNYSLGRFKTTLLLILCVWAITWISSFYVWRATIHNLHTLMLEGGPSHFYLLAEKMAYAEGYGYSIFEYIFKTQGGTFVYILLTLISLPILWKEMRTNRANAKLFALYGPVLIIGLFTMILYFLNIGFGPLRMIIYLVMLCTIFTGFILYRLIEKIRQINKTALHKFFALALIIILLVGVSINGMLNLYPSPYILSPNWQTTQTEIEGMNWFVHNRDPDVHITGITIMLTRFASLTLTPEEMKEQNIRRVTVEIPPYHFSYDNQSSLSASYAEDTYLGLTQRDKLLYSDIYPKMAEYRWYPSDFEKLEQYQSVSKLYTNGGFDTWCIDALK